MAASDTPGVSLKIVGMTDVGRVREHNEDAFLVLAHAGAQPSGNGESVEAELSVATVFAVCDGMGGAAAGEVASRMAAEKLASVLGEAKYEGATPDQISALMDRAVQDANDEILAEARDNAERRGMGTTLTAAIAVPGRVFISQVGDSRGYLLRKGKLVQLTKDQSLIQQLIEEGTLTEEEAEKLGGRNIVLQAVGVEDSLRVDTKHWAVLRGDVIVLCSDGLTGMIDDAACEKILNDCGDDLRRAAEELIEAANDGGGRDNITVVLARFEGEGLRAPMEALAADGEQAGAGFAAPPPPDVPNQMKKVGGVLALIIVFIIALMAWKFRTTADVTVSWLPADVPVVVTIESAEESGAGFEPRTVPATGGTETLLKLPLGKYRVVVTATEPGYFEAIQDLDIQTAGDRDATRLQLKPKPGAVVVNVATAHVRIIVKAQGDTGVAPVREQMDDWADPKTPFRLDSFPSGPVVVHVSRDGFEEHVSEVQVLLREGELTFDVGPLKEKVAALDVRVRVLMRGEKEDGSEDYFVDGEGFDVRVQSARETLGSGTTDASGSVNISVRQGTQEVRATKKGYSESPEKVTIGPEGASVTLTVEEQGVAIVVKGEGGTLFDVQRLAADGGWKVVGRRRQIGQSRPFFLKPGKYRIKLKLKDGDPRQLEPHEFQVLHGETEMTVELKN